MPRKTAKILAGLRAGARPRDLLGRLQLLLLALGLLSVAGIFPMVLVSRPDLLLFWILGLMTPPVLAMTWLNSYRNRSMGPLGDALTIGCMCLIAIPVDARWHGYLFALLAAAVIFTSAYGSLPHVLLRTTAMVAIEVGEGLADPAALTIAVVFATGFVIVACLMSGMVNSVALYEATSRREQVLAATGLDLVAASDLTEMAAAVVESGLALCGTLKGVRVSLAMVDEPDNRPLRFTVLGATGDGADELKGEVIEEAAIAPAGQPLANQRLLHSDSTSEAGPGDGPSSAPRQPCPFRDGEVLLTNVRVEDRVNSGGRRNTSAVRSCDVAFQRSASRLGRARSDALSRPSTRLASRTPAAVLAGDRTWAVQ